MPHVSAGCPETLSAVQLCGRFVQTPSALGPLRDPVRERGVTGAGRPSESPAVAANLDCEPAEIALLSARARRSASIRAQSYANWTSLTIVRYACADLLTEAAVLWMETDSCRPAMSQASGPRRRSALW